MRKKTITVLLLAGALLLSGCSTPSPLGSRLFAENVGIDGTENGIMLSMNTYLADLQGDSENGGFQSQGGVSVIEAMEKTARNTGREPYLPHNCALVIGRAAAEKGVGGVLRFFTEYNGCRGGVPLFVADGTAAEVLQCVAQSERLDARALGALADEERLAGRTVCTPLYRAVGAGINGTRDLCVPMLAVKENEVTVTGAAVLRDGQLAAQLNGNQTVGLQLIAGELQQTLVYCEVSGYGRVTLAVQVEKSAVQITEQANLGCMFVLQAACTAKVLECDFLPPPQDTLLQQRLREACAAQLAAWAQAAARRSFAVGTDPFGLGEQLRAQAPDRWKALSDSWRNVLQHSSLDAAVTVHIKNA